MRFIEVDKISYAYPAPEEYTEEWEDIPTENKRKKKTEFSGNAGGKTSAFSGKNENVTENVKASENESSPALDEASLSVEAGQFICILGRNGSGKSTMARMLNALLMPDEGTVWIDGKETGKEAHIWDIRAQVGMVFQNPDNQIIGSVVEEDVAFGLENLGVPSPEIRARVKESLARVNMTEFAKHSPNNLSGGQKQRVAVAGILAMEPKCIVLDEATAMLDPKGREEVMQTAIRLNKEKGITLIAITHYMDETLEADRIFVIDHGRVVMSGTPQEVFAQEKEIEALGLRLPQICKLAGKLRKAGIPVPADVLRTEELVAWLNKYQEDRSIS